MADALSLSVATAENASNQVRAVAVANAWTAYHGRFQATHLVKRTQVDDNVRLNFTRMVVDQGVSFLFGKPLTLSIDGADVDDDANPADSDSESDAGAAAVPTDPEEWLEKALAANGGMVGLQKLGLNGAVSGHPFVKIEPANPERNGHPYPRVVLLEPGTVEVETEVDDHERVERYVISYPVRLPSSKDLALYRQVVERTNYVAVDGDALEAAVAPVELLADPATEVQRGWRILEQISSDQGRSWVPIDRVVWPFPWAPILDCQNLVDPTTYYGLPDVDADLIAMNRAVNFVVTNINRILRFHGHPKTWGRGFTADQLRIAVDETIVLPHKDAELKNLEMASDLSAALEFYRELKAALLEIQRTPNLNPDKLSSLGAITGIALQILYQPLIEKTESKRGTYGQLLVDLASRLLELGGFGAGVRPTIHWPELVPDDPMSQAQTLTVHGELGVSKRTILEKLGYDPDVEAERRREEAADAQAMGQQMLTAFDQGGGADAGGTPVDDGGDPGKSGNGGNPGKGGE